MVALSEGLEDYLEAILLEEKVRRFVRTKDLADRLGVTSPSAHAAVKELVSLGLASHESYSNIELTRAGRKKAETVYARHEMLHRFFAEALGLPGEIADSSACGIEHHLDWRVTKKLARLIAFLEKKARESKRFAAEIKGALGDD
jgi:DtxR family Mn-dependent transcriptional regulator